MNQHLISGCLCYFQFFTSTNQAAMYAYTLVPAPIHMFLGQILKRGISGKQVCSLSSFENMLLNCLLHSLLNLHQGKWELIVVLICIPFIVKALFLFSSLDLFFIYQKISSCRLRFSSALLILYLLLLEECSNRSSNICWMLEELPFLLFSHCFSKRCLPFSYCIWRASYILRTVALCHIECKDFSQFAFYVLISRIFIFAYKIVNFFTGSVVSMCAYFHLSCLAWERAFSF